MSLQITLIRHGRPDKSLPNHREHPLSEAGHEQAKARRANLGSPAFDLVLHSGLLRAEETACDVAGLPSGSVTVAVPELFYADTDPRALIVDDLFGQLGHVTLREYYEQGGGQALKSLARDARRAIIDPINQNGASNVLVVGHGILTQGLCISLTGGNEPPFIDRVLGECQGYRLVFEGELEDAKVSKIYRI